MSFYNINVKIIRKCRKKGIFFFKSEKFLQIQLMSFQYINVETIGKCKNKNK